MDARLARMEMANDARARVDVTRARGTTRRGYGNHASARGRFRSTVRGTRRGARKTSGRADGVGKGTGPGG